MENYKHIEQLAERFLDGETTNREERELYDFFAAGDIPEHLQPYREMFAWLDGGLMHEAGKVQIIREIREFQEACKVRSRRRLHVVRGTLAAAAVVALFLLIRPMMLPSTYTESYIIRNGVKITDPAIVKPELEASQRWYEEQLELQEEMAGRIDAALQEISTIKSLT